MSNLPNWSPQEVEHYFIRHRIPIQVCGVFRIKHRVNGAKLLSMTNNEIRAICIRETKCNKQQTFHIINTINILQNKYYQELRYQRQQKRRQIQKERKEKKNRNHGQNRRRLNQNGRRPNKKRPSPTRQDRIKNIKRTNKNVSFISGGKVINYDISNNGKIWTESDLRDAWWLWLRYQNMETVAKGMQRTYIATLDKINLIRRAINECGDKQFEKNLLNPLWHCKYSLIDIIKQQSEREKKRNQSERLHDAGLIESDNDDQEESDSDDDCLVIDNMRKNINSSDSENDDNFDIKFNHNNHNHNNRRRRKRQIIDSDDNSDDDGDSNIKMN